MKSICKQFPVLHNLHYHQQLSSHSEPLLLSEQEMVSQKSSKGESFTFTSPHGLFMCLTIITILLSFAYVVISLEATTNEWKHARSKNLLLTPLINANKIEEARKLAKVDLFNVVSYSGFLTIDEDCKSHLFFWFFPASPGNQSTPLILWHGGGPGTSGLFALFQGTGPVLLDEEGKSWTNNEFPLTKHRSVLYLDSPVGTGFSYSEVGPICYANSSDDVADGAILALRQFYQLFPELSKNELYISSSSYGGKFLPVIAWRIGNDNQLDELSGDPQLSSSSINLKGIISISGFSDPIHQIDYGEFYYYMGLIDGINLKHFQSQEALGKAFIRSKQYFEAYQAIDPLIVGKSGEASYLRNITRVNYPYNVMRDLTEPRANYLMHRHEIFLNFEWVQQSIHVDSSMFAKRYKSSSTEVYNNLVTDLYRSVAGKLEDLLNSGKYKFLFTSGQFDLIVPHTTILKFLHELRWDYKFDFKEEGNSLYECKSRVIGLSKSMQNLTYVMLRNSGHHPFIDLPECTLDLLLNFTQQN